MAWRNSDDDRRRSQEFYGDPLYKKNKAIVRRQSGGRCQWIDADGRCGSRDRVECDHKIPHSQGGTHVLENLWDLCKKHHGRKTAGEGGGWRAPPADPDPSPRTTW